MSKFEIVDERVLEMASVSNIENAMDLNNTCLCESLNDSVFCNDTQLTNIIANGNSSEFIMEKLVSLNDVVFLITVSSDFVSIYSYVITEKLYKTGKSPSLII